MDSAASAQRKEGYKNVIESKTKKKRSRHGRGYNVFDDKLVCPTRGIFGMTRAK